MSVKLSLNQAFSILKKLGSITEENGADCKLSFRDLDLALTSNSGVARTFWTALDKSGLGGGWNCDLKNLPSLAGRVSVVLREELSMNENPVAISESIVLLRDAIHGLQVLKKCHYTPQQIESSTMYTALLAMLPARSIEDKAEDMEESIACFSLLETELMVQKSKIQGEVYLKEVKSLDEIVASFKRYIAAKDERIRELEARVALPEKGNQEELVDQPISFAEFRPFSEYESIQFRHKTLLEKCIAEIAAVTDLAILKSEAFARHHTEITLSKKFIESSSEGSQQLQETQTRFDCLKNSYASLQVEENRQRYEALRSRF